MGSFFSHHIFKPPTPSTATTHTLPVIYKQSKNKISIPIHHIHPLITSRPFPIYILFSHGNASDMGSNYQQLQVLSNLTGITIIHYDYIGYGLAKEYGPTTEKNVYESIDTVFDYMVNDCVIPVKNIILFGFSLGSGPSCYLASKHKNIRGLILEGAFTGVIKTVANNFILDHFDIFNNLKYIKSVKCPVYLIHGVNDTIIPFEHSIRMYEHLHDECKYKPMWLTGVGHNNIIGAIGERAYSRLLNKFVRYCFFADQ